MKTLKIFFWLTSVLLAILIGAVLVVTTLVDPNEYKPGIEKWVESKTGRQFKIGGDLALAFYPWMGLQTGAVELSNRAGLDELPMLSVDRISLKVKLIPLMKKNLEVGDVILSQPKVRLITFRDGSTNWDDLIDSAKSAGDEQGADERLSVAGLAVQGVSIVDGEILWDNRAAGQSAKISRLDLSTEKMQPGEPLHLALAALIEESTLSSPVAMDLSTTAMVNHDFRAVKLNNTSAHVEIDGKTFSLAIPSLGFNAETQNLQIPEFTLQQGDLLLSGRLTGSGVFDAAALNGQLAFETPDIAPVLREYGIESGAGGHQIEGIALDAGFSYINHSIQLNSLVGRASLNGRETVVELPFATLHLSGQKAGVPVLTITQNGLRASAGIHGVNVFSGGNRMILHGLININLSDVSKFMGNNRIGDILPHGLIDTVASEMDYRLDNGNLSLSAMNSLIDKTTLHGSVSFENIFSDSERNITARQNIKNINVGKVLTAFAVADNLTGFGDVNLNITGLRPDAEKPLENLGGSIGFKIHDGAMKGFDLQAALIRVGNAVQHIRSREETQYQPDARTRFSDLSASFHGINGRFSTSDIVMKAPALRVHGRGDVDLAGETLDLNFDVAVVETVAGQGGEALENLKGVTIPLQVKGNLRAPDYGLDISRLLEREVKKQLGKKLEEALPAEVPSAVGGGTLEEKLEKKLEGKLTEKLLDLFGN